MGGICSMLWRDELFTQTYGDLIRNEQHFTDVNIEWQMRTTKNHKVRDRMKLNWLKWNPAVGSCDAIQFLNQQCDYQVPKETAQCALRSIEIQTGTLI
jgi:hypothetical protein